MVLTKGSTSGARIRSPEGAAGRSLGREPQGPGAVLVEPPIRAGGTPALPVPCSMKRQWVIALPSIRQRGRGSGAPEGRQATKAAGRQPRILNRVSVSLILAQRGLAGSATGEGVVVLVAGLIGVRNGRAIDVAQ